MMSDWRIAESDEEWCMYNPPLNAKQNEPFISNRLIPLFKEIDEKKVLPLNFMCARKGNVNKEAPQSQLPVVSSAQHVNEERNKSLKENPDTNKSFEAFEFDEANEKPSLKRKTPASAKRDKKGQVATMYNVMNDLLRNKSRDESEANKPDEEAKDS